MDNGMQGLTSVLRPPSSVSQPAPYQAAVIQFEPRVFAKEANLVALLRLTEEAATGGAKLIVTPEMATTGYCWASREEIASEVEPIPGPTTARFAEIAARYGCWIVVGLPEVDPQTGVFYNTAVLIGPDGPLGRYRKTHAYISEPKWAKDGDLGLPVFETPLGRIAMTICMDACYPETARVPALAGADVICFPTNWLTEKSPSPSWMARAAENGVYFLAANRYGPPTARASSVACSSPAARRSSILTVPCKARSIAAMASSGGGSTSPAPATSAFRKDQRRMLSPTAGRMPTAS
jgi:predicted amidohydrolase